MAIYIMKSWYNNKKVKLVPWSTGTDAQINAILQAYYNNELSAEEIQALKTTYFPVGAKRSIPISAMEAVGVGESHHADNYEYVIIGQEHDTLTKSINGHGKALITVQQDRIFFKDTTSDTYSSSSPSSAEEGGIIDKFTTDVSWSKCNRRTWCNNTYYGSLPQYIQNNIKYVNKYTLSTSSSLRTSSDRAFLLSLSETGESATGEGSEYSYFIMDGKNVYKKPTYNTNRSANWWLRSYTEYSSTINFAKVYSDGAYDYAPPTLTYGICPAFCL